MKRFLPILALACLFISCEKQTNELITPDEHPKEVSVYFVYNLPTDNGSSMTKVTNADVFSEFYEKIVSAELVADTYDLVLTEINTGAKYEFKGNWNSHDMVTLRTGTYRIIGKSTASGDYIQDKCSFVFDEIVEISTSSSAITLTAKYDCYLLIFSAKDISTLLNFSGESSTEFYAFSSYKYAFVNNTLFTEGKANLAYIGGEYTDGAEFKCYTGNLSFEKGKYYVYSSVTGGFTVPQMDEGGNEGEDNGVKNLSAKGTANCYIAPKNGKYTFNASVKGNSSTPIGNTTSVGVVWETFNTSTQPNKGDVVKNVMISDGVISFETTENEGNALIAAKDAEGKILWSWHIWVTDYVPELDYDTYKGMETLKVMDRNLGALAAEKGEKSFGMVYQWGRKEPFMGKLDGDVFSATAEMESTTTSSIKGTDEYAIQHPTCFIMASKQGGDWRYSSDNTAWSNNKTLLDPCPIGWKVPEGGENGLWKNFSVGYSSWVFDTTNKGVTFGSDFATSDIWMPAQGYISDSTTYRSGWWQTGLEGRYWSTSTLGTKYSDFFSFNSTEIFVSHSSMTWSVHCSRATGMAVRCVEDK